MNGIRMPHRHRARAVGATLAELLVVATVLAVLGLVLIASVYAGREMARDVVCRSHLGRLAIATGSYANAHDGCLFVNRTSPLRISNVVYSSPSVTGWGHLYPRYLGNYHALFCPSDSGRGPAWEFGWSNWGTLPDGEAPDDGHDGGPDRGRHRGWTDPQPDHGRDYRGHQHQGLGPRHGWRRHRGDDPPSFPSEVQCSYGYRGRQGLVPSAEATFTISVLEDHAQRVQGCDYYEPFFSPPRIHHKDHVNVLRFSGQVERINRTVSFGPEAEDFDEALALLDRGGDPTLLQDARATPRGPRNPRHGGREETPGDAKGTNRPVR